MTFVAIPPASEVDAPTGPETAVINDGFFPDIDPAAIRNAARITNTVTPGRLRAAILGAIMAIEIDMRTYAAAQTAAGHATLATVPAPKLDGRSVQLIRYERAVALYAKAELMARMPDFDTTGAGEKRAEESTPTIGELRRDAMHAVRDMLGKTRTTVELI